MKKIVSMLVVLISMFIGIGVISAAGPASDGYIKVNIDSNATYLKHSTEQLGEVTGISYNSNTNTLTLNNYNESQLETKIEIYKMGDLKVVIKGSNTLLSDEGTFNIIGNNELDVVTFEGDGTLNLRGWGFEAEYTNVIINDIKLNGLLYNNSEFGIMGYFKTINLNNVKMDLKYGTYRSGGIQAEEIYVSSSTITGSAGQMIIYAENKAVFDNSTFSAVTLDNAGGSPSNEGTINSQGTLIIKNNSKIKINPTDELFESDNDFGYGTGISANDLTIEDSDVSITNQLIGIYGESATLKNSNINMSSYIGIMSFDLMVYKGDIVIKDSVFGILLHDSRMDEMGKLNIKEGYLNITIATDEQYQAYLEYFDDHYDNPPMSDYGFPIAISITMGTEPMIIMPEEYEVVGEGNIYSYKPFPDSEDAIYYVNGSEYVFSFENGIFDTDKTTFTSNLIIKDKNYDPNKKEEVNDTTKEESKEETTTTTTTTKIENPQTSDINLYLVIGMIVLSSLGIAITYKKLKRN